MIPVSVDSGHLVLCLSRIRPVDLILRKHLKMKVGGGGKKWVVLDVAFSILDQELYQVCTGFLWQYQVGVGTKGNSILLKWLLYARHSTNYILYSSVQFRRREIVDAGEMDTQKDQYLPGSL